MMEKGRRPPNLVRLHLLRTMVNNGLNPETGLPFHNSQSLPAGTLLTVRLRNPISADDPGANARFEAVVDEPVVIEGNSVVPRGATVAGRVESALASNVRRNRGYVRLVLDSIHLAGVNLPIQTSSLFVRGNSGDTQTGQGEMAQIHLEKGRRLTFRLTEPVYVAASQRVASRPLIPPSLFGESFPQKDFPF